MYFYFLKFYIVVLLLIIIIIYIYNSNSIYSLFSYDLFDENYNILSIVCIIYSIYYSFFEI